MEKQLRSFPAFVRIHKSHVVNLAYIVKYQKGDGGKVTFPDNSQAPVSRAAKAELLRKLGFPGS